MNISDDESALLSACRKNQLERIIYLIERKNIQRDILAHALNLACQYADINTIVYLGTKCKITDRCLMYAARGGKLDLVRYLVKKGCQITLSVIIVAIEYQNMHLVSYFFDQINKTNHTLDHMIHQCVLSAKTITTLEWLKKYGAIINNPQKFMSAWYSKDYPIIRYLLQHNIENKYVQETIGKLSHDDALYQYAINWGYKLPGYIERTAEIKKIMDHIFPSDLSRYIILYIPLID